MKQVLPAVLIVCVAACGRPSVDMPLSFEDRTARMQACNMLYRENDFQKVKPSPVRGLIDLERWNALSANRKDDVIELSACLMEGGDAGPVDVELFVSGRTVLRRQAENDTDWAAVLD